MRENFINKIRKTAFKFKAAAQTRRRLSIISDYISFWDF